MEEEKFQIYEWVIENFSHWNCLVHGSYILSPTFSHGEYIGPMALYPRWSETNSIKINYFIVKAVPSSLNLSIIEVDGSFITTRVTTSCGLSHFFPPGLEFEKVVAKIKKKTQYQDRLTVRLCFLSKEGLVDRVSTTLDVLKLSLNVDPKLLEVIEPGDSKNISLIHYNKKNYLDELLLRATRDQETIKLELNLLTMSKDGVSVEIKLNLFSSENKIVINEEKEYLFQSCHSWNFSNSLKMSELAGNSVTIYLNLKIVDGNVIFKYVKFSRDSITVPKKTICFFDSNSCYHIDSGSSTRTSDSVTALTKDFTCLYQNQKFSDLQIKCGDISFPVHRAILSARSPVFERLLSTDMKETTSGAVDITDIDASTMSHFLTFLYTGGVEDLQGESALKLYYAAHKYQVHTLLVECSGFLRANVTLSNVCDILSFAHKHQDDELTSAVHSFILNNYNEVLGSEKWRIFMKTETLLAAETLTDLGAKSSVCKISL